MEGFHEGCDVFRVGDGADVFRRIGGKDGDFLRFGKRAFIIGKVCRRLLTAAEEKGKKDNDTKCFFMRISLSSGTPYTAMDSYWFLQSQDTIPAAERPPKYGCTCATAGCNREKSGIFAGFYPSGFPEEMRKGGSDPDRRGHPAVPVGGLL